MLKQRLTFLSRAHSDSAQAGGIGFSLRSLSFFGGSGGASIAGIASGSCHMGEAMGEAMGDGKGRK